MIWVQHSDEELLYGSPGWQWVPELVPASGDALIHKHFNSSFEATDLEAHLAACGATHIVLAGAATNWCIRATAYGALDRGYDRKPCQVFPSDMRVVDLMPENPGISREIPPE
ncbi:hypothetical protein A9Q02_19190 [Candidatus Chloroploca asiatica]|uniref:Isochorismatase-like domain-containing protein n=1 Tax=Candidatus Chloroploca asiatica TaxID=1506545 RepID=A0A2H3KJ10_9CHLR|nr:hypothetical protein A9Q02_19190 [Candidatus Chloroploca asiatica]